MAENADFLYEFRLSSSKLCLWERIFEAILKLTSPIKMSETFTSSIAFKKVPTPAAPCSQCFKDGLLNCNDIQSMTQAAEPKQQT